MVGVWGSGRRVWRTSDVLDSGGLEFGCEDLGGLGLGSGCVDLGCPV